MGKVGDIGDKLKAVLGDIKESSGIDMNRMKIVINHKKLSVLSERESRPNSAITLQLLGDIIYGNTKEDVSL